MGKINTLLSLDGESDFKRKLQDINNNLKTLDKQLGEAATKFSMSSDKMRLNSETAANLTKQLDFLRQKQDLLRAAVQRADNQVADSNAKLEKARAAYDQAGRDVVKLKDKLEFAKKLWGENSVEVSKYAQRLKEGEERQKAAAKAVTAAENEVTKAKKAYHAMAQQLAETSSEVNKTEDKIYKLEHAEEQGEEEATRFTKVVEGLEKALDAFGKALQALPGILSAVGHAIATVATAPLKALEASFKAVTAELELGIQGLEAYGRAVVDAGKKVGEFSASKGMSFEAAMSKVAAYSQASEEDMQRLSDAAQEMGATTSKTATEAAEALGYLALNGYKTEEMLAVLKPIVKASEAGSMDLAQTAQLTAVALNVYGKKAEDAEEFLNILTAAQNNSATSLYDLLTAFTSLAGTFDMLHLDFNESATLMGLMANKGVAGTEAGTALNSVFLRLLETNKNSAEAFDQLGVSAYDSEGRIRNLYDIVSDLNTAMAGLNEQERKMIEKDLFGTMRFEKGTKLLDALSDSDRYSNLYDTVSNAYANNYLYSTAETMMNNLQGRITILKSAADALGIAIYGTFNDKVMRNVEKMTGWIDTLTDSVLSGNLEQVIPSLGEDIATALEANIEMVAEELPSKLRIFNAIIVAGAKALVRGIRASKNTILPVLITGALDLVTELLKVLPDFVVEVTDAAVILFGGLVDAMKVTSERLVKILPDIISTVSTAIAEHGPDIFDQGFDILVRLVQGISQNLPILLSAASRILDKLHEDLSDNTSQMSQAAIDIITALVHWIGENISQILEVGSTIIGEVVTAVSEDGTLEKLSDGAFEIIDALGEWIKEKSMPVFEKWMPDVIDNLKQVLEKQENKDKLARVGDALANALIAGFNATLEGLFNDSFTILGLKGSFTEQDVAFTKAVDDLKNFLFPNATTRDTKVSASNNSAYEAEAYGNGSSGDTININYPTINGVHNLSELVEEMAKLKQISDRAGGAFS